ncbi:transcriptional regulator, ArsR family [Granulicatella balaenopterae]|uniref:Transcriptional regulator, ArsR family n=1 Tax=Granulicatella balaenopterae TaxID=137733 RepID=A0A1H9PAD0_9LACT|nr:metalloregulator ArsR/SmtB family transcription factor [Granulicatella balaenopterae]SER45097.1 transcriptional regulator, ArsR family [Granulicatella balaenopterae]
MTTSESLNYHHDALADFFKLMGDPTRLKLLITLLDGEACVSDLSDKLNMTLSAISHQLKLLKLAKVVKARKEGKSVYYSLDDEHIHTILLMALEHVKERT